MKTNRNSLRGYHTYSYVMGRENAIDDLRNGCAVKSRSPNREYRAGYNQVLFEQGLTDLDDCYRDDALEDDSIDIEEDW